MKVDLLASDLDELREEGIDAEQAIRRGLEALGRRPTHERPGERPGTEAGVEELVHLYAEASASMRLLEFAFASESGEFDRSASEYAGVEETLADLRRDVIPVLRARLRELRTEETSLEVELRERGVDPDGIGPRVRPGTALDPSPRPGEGEREPRLLPPLPERRGLLRRVLGRAH